MNSRAPYSPPLPARKAHTGSEPHISAMRIRTRKFLGTVALLLLVVVWSLMGMTVAQTPWLANSGLLQARFYVAAGCLKRPVSGRLRLSKCDAGQHHPHGAQR